MCVCVCFHVKVLNVHTSPPVISHLLLHLKDGEIIENNVSSKLDHDLLSRLATPAGSTFELHHHDGDVVGAAAVERLEDDALGAKVRLIQTLADKPDGLLVAESVPQAIRRQDHELWLQFVQVKGHDVGVGDDYVEVFQRVVP